MADCSADIWEKMYKEFTSNCDNSDTEREEMENLLYSQIHFIHQESDLKPSEHHGGQIDNNRGVELIPCVTFADKGEINQHKVVKELSFNNFYNTNTGNKYLHISQTEVDASCTVTECNTHLSEIKAGSRIKKKLTGNKLLKQKKITEPQKKCFTDKIIDFKSKLALESMLEKNPKVFTNKLLRDISHVNNKKHRPVVEICTELSPVITEPINKVKKKTKNGADMYKGKNVKDSLACDDESEFKGEDNMKGNNDKQISQTDAKYKDDKKVKKQTNKALKRKKHGTGHANEDEIIEISSDFSPAISAPKIKRHVKEHEYTTKKNLNGNEVIVVSSTSEEKDTPIKVKKNKQNLTYPIVISDSESSSDSDKDMKAKEYFSDSDDECMAVLFQSDDADTKRNHHNLKINVHASQDSVLDIPNDSEKHWDIIAEDRYQHIYKRSRYFLPKSIRCFNCNKIGHMSPSCQELKKFTACVLCGLTGHLYSTCPESFCFICNSTDHVSRSCPYAKRQLNTECRRCFMLGHQQNACPDIWRQYHMTIKSGNPIQVKEGKSKNRTCYNCGSKSHLGFACENRRMNKYTMATYPYIAKYKEFEPVKGNKRTEFADSNGKHVPVKKKRKCTHKNNTSQRKKEKNTNNSALVNKPFGDDTYKGIRKGGKKLKGENHLKNTEIVDHKTAKAMKKKQKRNQLKNNQRARGRQLREQSEVISLGTKERTCLSVTDSVKDHKMKKQRTTTVPVPVNHKIAPHKNISRGFKLHTDKIMKKIKR